MKIEILGSDDRQVTRRLTLEPGEMTPWHTDACRRYSVVLGGDRLAIEFLDAGYREEFPVHYGKSGWDEPDARPHRAVNTGLQTFIEVVTFLRPAPDVEIQPVFNPPPSQDHRG